MMSFWEFEEKIMGNEWVKRNKWIYFAAPLAIALFVWIGGEVVMHLWNWLLPALFGWRIITFWQALGLLVLCRILFGGWGGHDSHHSNSGRRMAGHWMQMTPEEREKLHSRWCGCRTSAEESKEPA
jgi:hypothetical protein